MMRQRFQLIFILTFILSAAFISFSFAEFMEEKEPSTVNGDREEKKPIIVNGDMVEFVTDTQQVLAEGNVIIDYEGTILRCDKITVNKFTCFFILKDHLV